VPFAYLEELNLSFNHIEDQTRLFYCGQSMPNLKYLIVTGNPFTITGEEVNYEIIQSMMERKSFSDSSYGQLINETLNAPTYIRRGASKKPFGHQLMIT